MVEIEHLEWDDGEIANQILLWNFPFGHTLGKPWAKPWAKPWPNLGQTLAKPWPNLRQTLDKLGANLGKSCGNIPQTIFESNFQKFASHLDLPHFHL